jgi:hypothetical protein
MQGSDYRKKYVTCDDYKESEHAPSDVDLLSAFNRVSVNFSASLQWKSAARENLLL